MLLGVLGDTARLEFKDASTAVVFDNDYEKPSRAAAIYDAWRERTGHPGFGPLAFTKGKLAWDITPLQCADLLAGLMRRDPASEAWLNPQERLARLNNPGPMHHAALKAAGARSRGTVWSLAVVESVVAARRRFGASKRD
jgi:hypothetical protein